MRRAAPFAIAMGAFLAVAAAGAFVAYSMFSSAAEHDHATPAAGSTPTLEYAGIRADGTIDLGEHPRGVTREFTLAVRNPSTDEAVRIERISASCTCTIVRGLPVTVPPGETVEIPYSIDLPVGQDNWAVVLYLFYDKETSPDTVRMSVRLPDPYPAHAAAASGEPIRLPISSIYIGLIGKVECFAFPGDEVVPSRLDDAGAALIVDAPPAGAQRLEIITTVADPAGGSARFAHHVALDPPIGRTAN